MVKIGQTVIYKGRAAQDYVGKKAKVMIVGEEFATVKFSNGHVHSCARIKNLKPVVKKQVPSINLEGLLQACDVISTRLGSSKPMVKKVTKKIVPKKTKSTKKTK